MMEVVCGQCGARVALPDIPAGPGVRCPSCGAALPAPVPGAPVAAAPVPLYESAGRRLGLIALILGLSGVLPVLGLLTGLAAIVVGIASLVTRRYGRGLAVGGIVCGLILPVLSFGVLSVALWIAAAPRARTRAKQTVAAVLMNQVELALDRYNLDVGHYPTEQEGGLKALLARPDLDDEPFAARWHGPYLKRRPLDPWGNPLNYELTDPGSDRAAEPPFKLWSNGPDGEDDGGAGDDIRNRAWKDAESAD